MRTLLTAAAAAVLLAPAPLMAQGQDEAPKPEKHENVTRYAIEHIDFVTGKRDAALEIIKKHYAPAGVEAGTPGPVMHLEHRTGEWDLTVIWHMKRGPEGMEWKRTPEDIAWEKKFVEMAGGEEEAKEIGEEFSSYIARSTSMIAMQDEKMMTAMSEGMKEQE